MPLSAVSLLWGDRARGGQWYDVILKGNFGKYAYTERVAGNTARVPAWSGLELKHEDGVRLGSIAPTPKADSDSSLIKRRPRGMKISHGRLAGDRCSFRVRLLPHLHWRRRCLRTLPDLRSPLSAPILARSLSRWNCHAKPG